MIVHEIVPGLFQSPTPETREDARFTDPDDNEVHINAIVDLEGGIDPVVPQASWPTCISTGPSWTARFRKRTRSARSPDSSVG
jgi:hypothetical protein